MSLQAWIEGLQMFTKTKNKGARQKMKEEKENDRDILSQNVWRKNYRPFVISNPISSSVFNQIEQFLCHRKQKLED
jgi:hypothetical protein